jgi:hypothetical protein
MVNVLLESFGLSRRGRGGLLWPVLDRRRRAARNRPRADSCPHRRTPSLVDGGVGTLRPPPRCSAAPALGARLRWPLRSRPRRRPRALGECRIETGRTADVDRVLPRRRRDPGRHAVQQRARGGVRVAARGLPPRGRRRPAGRRPHARGCRAPNAASCLAPRRGPCAGVVTRARRSHRVMTRARQVTTLILAVEARTRRLCRLSCRQGRRFGASQRNGPLRRWGQLSGVAPGRAPARLWTVQYCTVGGALGTNFI